MANIYKATKIQVIRNYQDSATPHRIVCSYTDPTTVPPTPGIIGTQANDSQVQDQNATQDLINAALVAAGLDTINFDI